MEDAFSVSVVGGGVVGVGGGRAGPVPLARIVCDSISHSLHHFQVRSVGHVAFTYLAAEARASFLHLGTRSQSTVPI